MKVIGDVVARDRRSESIALRTASRSGSYSYEKCCTQAWKAGNLLRHYGVRAGATVAIVTGESLSPPPVVSLFGSALLGATAQFDPESAAPVDARVLVAPAAVVDAYETEPGTKVLAYGGDPDDPTVAGFEREVWSENPTMPPDAVEPSATALTGGGAKYTHERLLDAAEAVVADAGLLAEDVVVPRTPLHDPGVVVAGLLAPLSVGATVCLDETATGDVGVGRDVPEERSVNPADVL